MSRVGKKPIETPKDVKIEYRNSVLTVKGPKGVLKREIHPKIILNIDGPVITFVPVDQSRESQALWGLTRSLVANMVEGVSVGFTRVLEIVGVGYRAEVKGRVLNLALGYSHPIDFVLPDEISASVDKKNRITLQGADKELLGLTAARIRALRKPEPYKGKGIKYAEEVIQRKVGKAGAK
ncbi:MAG: 50S ribosomal protein L6 [Thermodesulfobacteriota bacterium]|nr:50S ribosomal protein L6 [Thermodesulfobacteriota bacterium]